MSKTTEAIELGKMIKQRQINDICEHDEKLMGNSNAINELNINL